MYKNTNCFHLAIPCGDLETAKKFYSETLGCRLDNSAQEWADVDFWGNELTLHASDHKLDSERHDVDMGIQNNLILDGIPGIGFFYRA